MISWCRRGTSAPLLTCQGQGHLLEGTFPRGDYREFLQLVVVSLGGEREEGFTFKVPGSDHHARWMSKGIY